MERIPSNRSRFEAPATVRVSASRPGSERDNPVENEITLHFVNYNREEPAEKRSRGNGIRDEKPVAAPPCRVDLKLPADFRTPGLRLVRRIEFLTPEEEQARKLEFEQVGDRLRFRIPDFLVYGVVRVELSRSE